MFKDCSNGDACSSHHWLVCHWHGIPPLPWWRWRAHEPRMCTRWNGGRWTGDAGELWYYEHWATGLHDSKQPPTHIFFREVASRSAKISELIAMAQRLLLGTGKATLKHGLQHLHDMEWNITREHVRLCSWDSQHVVRLQDDGKTHARLQSWKSNMFHLKCGF